MKKQMKALLAATFLSVSGIAAETTTKPANANAPAAPAPAEKCVVPPAPITPEVKEQLVQAVMTNNAQALDLLLQMYPALANDRDPKNGITPLMVAAANDLVELVDVLLKHKADINTKDKDGNTALMLTLETKAWKGTRLLIDAGANLDIANNEGQTALLKSVGNKWTPLSLYLINKGANVNLGYGKFNVTPLVMAVETQDEAVVKALIEKKANVNSETTIAAPVKARMVIIEKITPLMIAAQSGNEKITKMLLDAGANPYAEDSNGATALHYAYHNNQPKTFALLENFKTKKFTPKGPSI